MDLMPPPWSQNARRTIAAVVVAVIVVTGQQVAGTEGGGSLNVWSSRLCLPAPPGVGGDKRRWQLDKESRKTESEVASDPPLSM